MVRPVSVVFVSCGDEKARGPNIPNVSNYMVRPIVGHILPGCRSMLGHWHYVDNDSSWFGLTHPVRIPWNWCMKRIQVLQRAIP